MLTPSFFHQARMLILQEVLVQNLLLEDVASQKFPL